MRLIDELILLYQSPKDYLYSFKYFGKGNVVQKPFDPDTKKAADKLISEIKSACPEIEIDLVGSTAFQIVGGGDIDINAACTGDQISKNASMISRILGEPVKKRKNFVEWNCKYESFDVELTLFHSKNKRYADQMQLFHKLKKNEQLLREYSDFKRNSNYKSRREYILERMKFFNKVMRKQAN